MKIEEILIESRGGYLYHGTPTLSNGESILRSNTILGTFDPIANINTISFSRNPAVANHFATSRAPAHLGVVFTLDQGLLYRDFGKKLKPYSQRGSVAADTVDTTVAPEPNKPIFRAESEEQLSLVGNLTNLSKYLVSVDIVSSYYDENTIENYLIQNSKKFPLLNKYPDLEITGKVKRSRDIDQIDAELG